jgi:hypothetical protein
LTEDNQSLGLLFEEENGEIKDIYKCASFNNDKPIKIKSKIYLSFYDDEKANYIPTSKHLALQKAIENAFYKFNQFKNDVIDIDDFCEWNLNCEKLYDKIDIYERMSFKFIKPFQDLVYENSAIQKLISFHPLAKKAMDDFNKLPPDNEAELIEWSLNYHDTELSYGIPEKIKNEEQYSLILHPSDNSIVIDCTKYAESLHLSEIQSKYYWEFYNKYRINGAQFYKEKANNKDLQFNLETFLNIRGIQQQLSFFKILKKPVYGEFVIGKPTAKTQFIEIAGKELGVNVRVVHFGTAQSFINDKGEVQLEASPELINLELENEKATKFYNNEIGLDWKSRFQNKIKELNLKYQNEDTTF